MLAKVDGCKLNILRFISLLLVLTPSFANAADNYGRFNAISCTGSGTTSTCVGVGYRLIDKKAYPLLVESLDRGKTYTVINDFKNLSVTEGTLLSVNCQGQGIETHCMAVGYLGPDKEHAEPLILNKSNGQAQWERQSYPGFKAGLLTSVAYFTGTYKGCLAVGFNPTGSRTGRASPIFIESDATYKTWHEIKAIHDMLQSARLTKVSCGIDSYDYTKICAVIGFDIEGQAPIVIDSFTGPWTIRSGGGLGLGAKSVFEDVSCGFSFNDTPKCMAVGHTGVDASSYIPIYADYHPYWISIAKFPRPNYKPAALSAVNCFRNSDCKVAGTGTTNASLSFGFLGTYLDWNKWSSPETEDIGVTWRTISCTKTGTLCIAAGDNNYPYLGQNKNKNWVIQKLESAPANSLLRTSSCTDDGDQALCVIAGYYQGRYDHRGQPLLIQTSNGGDTWEVKNISFNTAKDFK